MELLRPRSWIEGNHIRAGQRLPLNIPEVEGFAYVSSIEECPAISSGEGSAVTGRFITRRVDEIARIEVLGADGTTDTLEGTTIHPIWSLDRNDWVPLGELREAEQLLGQAGPASVVCASVVLRSTPVYNIEVHGEHVYQVGELGVLVHNTCGGAVRTGHGVFGWGSKSNTMRASRQIGDRMKSSDDALQQLAEIEKAQALVRQGKSRQIIDSIEKSKQRAKNALNSIKNLDDLLDLF